MPDAPAPGRAPRGRAALFFHALTASSLAPVCVCWLSQDTVDAMRLLCDPQRLQRTGHRFKVIAIHAAHGAYCSTMGGSSQPPKMVVTEAPPQFTSWADPQSFPHG